MIVGLGTDIVKNDRIRNALNRHGDRFLKRIFTDEEIAYASGYSDPVPHLAARFAVKEAAVKALNLKGNEGLRLRDVEVSGRIHGKKSLVFQGSALCLAEKMGVSRYHLSLSHTSDFSMAVVILESDQLPGEGNEAGRG